MTTLGPGVERLAEEAAALWPDARLAILSSDLAEGPAALKARIEQIAAGGADLVIGTQLVSKGHNFPLLTLVGVIDADLGLQGGDLRAAEKTFQLIRQVAGRAGRAERPGLALVQTHQPEHPALRAILSGDDEGFWRAEAEARRRALMPPYGRLAAVIVTGTDEARTWDAARALARTADPLRAVGAELWGPAPAPIARIRGRHRVRLLVRAAKGVPLQPALRALDRSGAGALDGARHRRRRSPELLLTPDLHKEVRVEDLAGRNEVRDRVDGAGDSDEMEPERCAVVETHVDGGAPRCLRDRIDGGHQVVQQATRALIDEAGDRDPVVAPEVRDHVRAARLGREDEGVNSAAADERIPPEAADQNVPACPAFSRLPSPPPTCSRSFPLCPNSRFDPSVPAWTVATSVSFPSLARRTFTAEPPAPMIVAERRRMEGIVARAAGQTPSLPPRVGHPT